jgi:hypothetical protein
MRAAKAVVSHPRKILIFDPCVPGTHQGFGHASFWRFMRKKSIQQPSELRLSRVLVRSQELNHMDISPTQIPVIARVGEVSNEMDKNWGLLR